MGWIAGHARDSWGLLAVVSRGLVEGGGKLRPPRVSFLLEMFHL
jgi:hypothetical protein